MTFAESKVPWYFSRRFVIVILAAIMPLSPLALPLLWWSPRFSAKWKAGITVVVVGATWFFLQFSVSLLNSFYGRVRELKELGLIS